LLKHMAEPRALRGRWEKPVLVSDSHSCIVHSLCGEHSHINLS
jgi:hypothetical protein